MELRKVRRLLAEGKSIYDLPLRVAYYARVSTEKDEQINSLGNQVQYFETLIREKGAWTFAGGYVDEGISGTSVKRRESFLRMLEDARQGKFDFLITKEISRFSRNTLECQYYVDLLKEHGLFFGTSIATCIMVMKKGKKDNKVLFIDATNECIKVTNNNKLTAENIDKIVDTYAGRSVNDHFSYLADYNEVASNDYNLSVSTYVEAEDTREKIDIIKLNAEIAEIVTREQVLRDEIDKIIAEIEG